MKGLNLFITVSDQALAWLDQRIADRAIVLRPNIMAVHLKGSGFFVTLFVGEGSIFPISFE